VAVAAVVTSSSVYVAEQAGDCFAYTQSAVFLQETIIGGNLSLASSWYVIQLSMP